MNKIDSSVDMLNEKLRSKNESTNSDEILLKYKKAV